MNRRKIQKVLNRFWQSGDNLEKEIIHIDNEKDLINDLFALHVVSTRSFNELEMLAEDLECVKMWLDDKKAPKTDSNGNEYSVVGRIQCLLNVC